MTASLELEDCDDGIRPVSKKSIKSCSLCVGCGGAITDKFILRVQPDLEWHARCLRCVKCNRGLDERNTCFVKEGKTYCKEDYQKLFLQVCASCSRGLHKSDYVLHVGGRIYHISCLKCVACNRILQTGDEFALRPNGVMCLDDHQRDGSIFNIENNHSPPVRTECVPPINQPASPLKPPKLEKTLNNNLKSEEEIRKSGCCRSYLDSISDDRLLMDAMNNNSNNAATISRANSRISYVKGIMDDSSMNSDIEDASQDGSSVCGNQSVNGAHGGDVSVAGSLQSTGSGVNCSVKMSGSKRNKEQKTTRVRTVLNEKQLHTLRTCYAANPRPDALMKEQLVEMTGLSPRVIRVWFQNKRCKDKKRQIMVKQLDQHQQVTGLDCALQGVPLVAGSPMRNEPPISCSNPIEIQQIHAPWSSDEFGPNFNHVELSRPSDSAPAFQQLISAYHHLSRSAPCPPPLIPLSHSPAHSQPPSSATHSNISILSAMGLLSGSRSAEMDDSPQDSFSAKLAQYTVE